MNSPLADYVSALEARDGREQAHAEYINAYTKLADRTAALLDTLHIQRSQDKDPPAPQDAPLLPGSFVQLRAELASTQKIRSGLEHKVSEQKTALESLKVSEIDQKKRIAHLEKVKEQLERRIKDRGEELKGKGKFVEDVQDEMVALSLQLNMAEKERDRVRLENEELTRRWVQKMEAEARKLNEQNDERKGDRGNSGF